MSSTPPSGSKKGTVLKEDNSGAIIGCLGYLAIIPISALWSGYVLSTLWGWFIVPTFKVRPLNVLPAIGVAMVVRYLTQQYDSYTDESKSATERTVIAIGVALLHPTFALFFGWILHSFM
jgi:hypothetical protein